MRVKKDGRVYNVSGVQLSAFLAAGYTEDTPKKKAKKAAPDGDSQKTEKETEADQ